MGKPSKRRNPGVGVDFRKVKHKVGKKLPKAQNDTNTDFKSRSINLPTQSLAQDKAGAAVSERNLTLKVRFGGNSVKALLKVQ
jgi:pre-rRNA-processing protein IPI1